MHLLDIKATMTLVTGYDAKRSNQVISRSVKINRLPEKDPAMLLANHGYPPIDNDEVYKEIFDQAKNFKKYQEMGWVGMRPPGPG